MNTQSKMKCAIYEVNYYCDDDDDDEWEKEPGLLPWNLF